MDGSALLPTPPPSSSSPHTHTHPDGPSYPHTHTYMYTPLPFQLMAQVLDTLLVCAAARCRPPRREEAVALLASRGGNRYVCVHAVQDRRFFVWMRLGLPEDDCVFTSPRPTVLMHIHPSIIRHALAATWTPAPRCWRRRARPWWRRSSGCSGELDGEKEGD